MKKTRIIQAAAVLILLVTIASCGPSREYQSYPSPRPRTSVSLILSTGPGIIVSRDPYGRSYYRSPEGYTYWRGYDNRYYLDRRYMSRNYYNHYQYNDWRRYHGRRR